MIRQFFIVALVLILAAAALAADRRPPRPRPDALTIHGAVVGTARTEADTVYIIGGPGRVDGRFEDAAGNPAWNGWTHRDLTLDPSAYWHVSEFMAPSGQYAMWCGTDFDGDPGYGNSWIQSLVFTHPVADPSASSTVDWTGLLRNDPFLVLTASLRFRHFISGSLVFVSMALT